MTPEELACFMRLLLSVPPGNAIEFGVFRGVTLRIIADNTVHVIGVDSFAGMPEPTERDEKDGWIPYPKGRLAATKASVEKLFLDRHDVTLIRGFVPAVLPAIEPHVGNGFSFAHIDMDQYDSTYAALEWLWPRMVPGGVICCDDYFASREWLAAGAINKFVTMFGRPLAGYEGRKAWFQF